MGEKMGDYASLSLFASSKLFNTIGTVLQVKAEWVDKMTLNDVVLNYGYPNYDPEATGSKKVFVSPQINYSFLSRFTAFALADIPVYQYVTRTQIASEFQMSFGASYRFFLGESECADD